MKESINQNHIMISNKIISLENDILNIEGIEYYKFLGKILYPRNSFNTKKYYLVSLNDNDTIMPINYLSEKSKSHDMWNEIFNHIKLLYPTIRFNDNIILNMIVYKNTDNININKYYMKDIISPKIKYVYFDWGSTLGAPGKSRDFYRTTDKKYLNTGSEELLQYLHSNHIPMGIISNRNIKLDEFRGYLEKAGLLKFFKTIILSSEGFHKKPHNEMFIEGIKRTQLPPNNLLYVGNNYLKDIITATKNGYQTAYQINDNKGYEFNGIANYSVKKMSDLIGKINI
jgi:hypothetical protein